MKGSMETQSNKEGINGDWWTNKSVVICLMKEESDRKT